MPKQLTILHFFPLSNVEFSAVFQLICKTVFLNKFLLFVEYYLLDMIGGLEIFLNLEKVTTVIKNNLTLNTNLIYV